METNNEIYSTDSRNEVSFAKVFGWLFLGIAISGSLSYLVPLLCVTVLNPSSLIGFIIAGVFIQLIVPFIISFKTMFAQKASKVAFWYVVDAIGMGFLLSSIWLAYDTTTIMLALLTSAGVFGIMALYGLFSKRNLNHLGTFGIMFLFGAIVVSLFNFFIGSAAVDYFVSIAVLAAVLALVAFDMFRIKSIAYAGLMNDSLGVYFAFMLYTDFINIFIRLVVLLGNRNQ